MPPKEVKAAFFKPNFNDPLLQRKRMSTCLQISSRTWKILFGHDFSGVTVHKDSSKATELNARAFTQGVKLSILPPENSIPAQRAAKTLSDTSLPMYSSEAGVTVNPTSVMGKGISLNDDAGLVTGSKII